MRAAFTIVSPRDSALRALNYSPFLELFNRPRSGLHSLRLGDLLASMGPAYGTVFTRIDCAPAYGVELLSQTDMFAAEPAGRMIRADSMANPERHRVKLWQILIAGAGTLGETELYGRSVIADARTVDKFVGPDAMALTFHDPGSVENLYVYAFLCTAIGVSVVRSSSYGTKILRLGKTAVADIRIPDAASTVKQTVADLVKTAVLQRGLYIRELHAARKVIEELREVRDALEECHDRRARCGISAGPFHTIDARNYVSLGEAQQRLVRIWGTQLADVLEPNGIFNGPRFTRIPCSPPHGIDLLDQRDVFSIRAVPRRIVPPNVKDRLLFVPQFSLLVASNGQFSEGSLFGKVETASAGFHKCGISQHSLRLLPKPGHHDWLFAFLSSPIGFHLLRSTAVGTSIPMMRTDLLAALPYPPLNREQVNKVSQHIQAAVIARVAAAEAEGEAVRIIEQEVLPAWLN